MFPRWPILVKISLATITVVMTLYSILLIGPYIEARLFPVLDKLHITSAVEMDNNRIELRVWANKMRNCEYVGLSWYRGSPDTMFSRVPIVLMRSSEMPQDPTRPLGPQSMGPWYLSMSLEDLYQNSFAEVTYRCHILWPTVIRVFP